MLDIKKNKENGKAELYISGELDTISSNDLKSKIEGFLDDVTELTIDMEGLDYITSAGLRILLEMAQTLDEYGKIKVFHVNENVMDVFEVTGFTEVLEIK